MFKNKRHQSGFTLIEALVSVAVFAIVVSIASGIYISVISVQKKSVSYEKTQRNARHAMETMARLSRMYAIDYEKYAELTNAGTSELYLKDPSSGKEVEFYLKDYSVKYKEGNASEQVLTSDDVDITRLKFYISPTGGESLSQNWPTRVTIVLEAFREGARGASATIPVQTTVITRIY